MFDLESHLRGTDIEALARRGRCVLRRASRGHAVRHGRRISAARSRPRWRRRPRRRSPEGTAAVSDAVQDARGRAAHFGRIPRTDRGPSRGPADPVSLLPAVHRRRAIAAGARDGRRTGPARRRPLGRDARAASRLPTLDAEVALTREPRWPAGVPGDRHRARRADPGHRRRRRPIAGAAGVRRDGGDAHRGRCARGLSAAALSARALRPRRAGACRTQRACSRAIEAGATGAVPNRRARVRLLGTSRHQVRDHRGPDHGISPRRRPIPSRGSQALRAAAARHRGRAGADHDRIGAMHAAHGRAGRGASLDARTLRAARDAAHRERLRGTALYISLG